MAVLGVLAVTAAIILTGYTFANHENREKEKRLRTLVHDLTGVWYGKVDKSDARLTLINEGYQLSGEIEYGGVEEKLSVEAKYLGRRIYVTLKGTSYKRLKGNGNFNLDTFKGRLSGDGFVIKGVYRDTAGRGGSWIVSRARRLFVKTVPENSQIKISNIREKFYQGITLKPGSYQLEVSAKGYKTHREWVAIDRTKDKIVWISLEPLRNFGSKRAREQNSLLSRIFVKAEPANARIRILNIKPKFYQGMKLRPGRYLLEISAKGYKKKKMWVKLKDGETKQLSITLVKHVKARASELKKTSENQLVVTREHENYDDPLLVPFLGTWEGRGVQIDGSTWSIKIIVTPPNYWIEYPSLSCGGKLDLIEKTNQYLRFKEHIHWGRHKCISGETVEISKLASKKIRYRWFFADGREGATGELIKKTQKKSEFYKSLMGMGQDLPILKSKLPYDKSPESVER